MIMTLRKNFSNFTNFVESSSYYWDDEPIIFNPNEEIDSYKPTLVDLFCGMGGSSIGFEMAGFETIMGLDIHKPSIQTFKKAHPKSSVILGDIKKIIEIEGENKDTIIENELKKRLKGRNLDVLMAGIPCQGFSLANKKRNVYDERNSLFFYLIECIKILKPKIVVIENVSGLTTLEKGLFVETIKEHLIELGYPFVTNKIINSAEYGVPQNRRRVLFVAQKEGKTFNWPKPIRKKSEFVTIKEAIDDLPSLENNQIKNHYKKNKELSEYQKKMRRTDSKIVHNHKSPKHPNETIMRIKNTKQGHSMYENYKQRIRLSWNELSPTQVSGGIRPQFQFGHPKDNRGLSIRERCRIQSIPDDIEVMGGIVQGRVQTGNAVPPILAKVIGEKIRECLNEEDKKYV